MVTTPRHLMTQTIEVLERSGGSGSDGAPAGDWVSTDPQTLLRAYIVPQQTGDSLQYGTETTTDAYKVIADPVEISGSIVDFLNSHTKIVWNGNTYRVASSIRNPGMDNCVLTFTMEREI